MHIPRRTVALTFSPAFEQQLLNFPTAHASLTSDLEHHIRRGLSLLEELEDVNDLRHQAAFSTLVKLTNQNCQMQTPYFKDWYLEISEELLDAIDLMVLTHGEDLQSLGLTEMSPATMLILVATASLVVEKTNHTAKEYPTRPLTFGTRSQSLS